MSDLRETWRIAARITTYLLEGVAPDALALTLTGTGKGRTVGDLASHEARHRGQVALTLRSAGHPLDKKIAFGLWEWGTRLRTRLVGGR